MSELLVRVEDKTHADERMDVGLTKSGDIIVIRDDGWPWGTEERARPFWRLIRVLDLPANEEARLTTPEIRDSSPAHLPQKRAVKLDFDLLSPLLKIAILQPRGAHEPIEVSYNEIKSAFVVKEKRFDASIAVENRIGEEDSNIIG